MPSSKFAQPRIRMKTPAVCTPHTPPCDPRWLDWPPPHLAGQASFLDLDPLFITDTAAYIDLHETTPKTVYTGRTPVSGSGLQLDLWRAGPPDHWTMALVLYFEESVVANIIWSGIHVDPTKAFDTGLLTLVTIPGRDQQHARIIA